MMLFHPSLRTDSLRFWMKQHEAPATFPRLAYVRIISRSFPRMIQIDARDLTTGVTCGEILDAIFEYLYSDVTKDESENVSETLKLHIFSSYEHNRSTDPNVPGGGLGVALKRLDWLGNNTMFGGLVLSDKFTMEDRGDIPPATFELKCLPNCPPTPQELHEQGSLRQQVIPSPNESSQFPSSSSPTIQPQKGSLRQNATRSTHRSQSTGPPFSLELYITFDGNQS
ncbi:hypothetical protein BKA83DRAFT_3643458 [Pisolithus microcarpus]|nr:hypothetical protein BKA83DRAFT_3643458 [Pisolithus microcarpus]